MTARRPAAPPRLAPARSQAEIPAAPRSSQGPSPGQQRISTERATEPTELRRLRRRIDALDRRIVALLNERAKLALSVGRAKRVAGWRAVRDVERERDVLERVATANEGPLPQAALLAIYRRIIAATRALEARRNGLNEEA